MTTVEKSSNATDTIRVGVPIGVDANDVARFVFRPDVVKACFGRDAVLQPETDGRVLLPHFMESFDTRESSVHAHGTIASVDWMEKTGADQEFKLSISFLNDGHHASDSTVVFRVITSINKAKHRKCKVRVLHSGLNTSQSRHSAVQFWQKALNRLSELLSEADGRRKRIRQAVVVVHGVGEQRPGQTLRNFVGAIFSGNDDSSIQYVKPDYNSELFEMRTVTVIGRGGKRPTTDVYELYWAHLIRDTTIGQVYGWIAKLLLSPTKNIPDTLRRHVWVARILPIVAVAIVGIFMTDGSWSELWKAAVKAIGVLAVIPTVFWGIWRLFQNQFVLGFAGDAARYLEPKPDNILKRQEIREEGVKLLNSLHDSGRYSRIIMYGHSLGSVIAYDIICHAWTRRSRQLKTQCKTKSTDLLAVENLLNPRPNLNPEVTQNLIRKRQHAAWLEYRRNGFDWLVSDFVTAGSPLAHARWLLNLDKTTKFDDLVSERSMPTCPPQTEIQNSPHPNRRRKVFTFTHAYPAEENWGRKFSVQVPHHAGLFALTRWSNLYFPFSKIAHGDPIGGPLKATFGTWIDDLKLDHPGAGFLGFAHTLYTTKCDDNKHIDRLRDALELGFGNGLQDPFHQEFDADT